MSDLFLPSNPIYQKATASLKNLRGIDAAAIDLYAEKLATSAAPALGAVAEIGFIFIYGSLTVDILADPYKHKHFKAETLGLGLTEGKSVGVMYTAYANWDAFFANVTSYHVHGIAEGGGFLQINWFRKDAVPVGQFNGAMIGEGLLEAGGPGKWRG